MEQNNTTTTDKHDAVANKQAAVELGRRIRSIRVLTGVSQEELVARTGLSRNTIIGIEVGKYNTGVRQLNQILSALGYEMLFRPTTPDHGILV